MVWLQVGFAHAIDLDWVEWELRGQDVQMGPRYRVQRDASASALHQQALARLKAMREKGDMPNK